MTPLKSGTIDLILLSALREQPRYGLELAQHIGTRSGGLFELSEGSLYPALLRLNRAGLIEGEWHPTPGGGSPRKVYRLTDQGATELTRRRDEWQRLQTAVNALLGGRLA
ncbi:PadR family transcriptional regulator [Deinococcus arcticus]|uniref:PadR family transcriptional regulator n=1 Tax=Deinococcus arcticus TaxID=2136176 RepID=A0A2T3WB64_9DEIO|nr:PadR family transcriptional regulator [Deinococcus arcticus]PTA69145.1 PadR family transcriptional regulator [Deinococcus arcticus]